jgi:hypothetical protein
MRLQDPRHLTELPCRRSLQPRAKALFSGMIPEVVVELAQVFGA